MRTVRAFVTLFVLALVAGCAGQGLAPSAAATRNDAFLPFREITTPGFKARLPEGGEIHGHLGARRDKQTGAVTTHAILGIVYAQKLSRRYEFARNARTEALPLRLLVHDGVGCRRQTGCAHMELFQADIPEADLRRARSTDEGYAIKLFGRLGHATLFPIPKELVAALIEGIDRPAGATVAGEVSSSR